ncbi:MAG: T9SS type A sorting domain-containing protein [Bacteroidota bacterium]
MKKLFVFLLLIAAFSSLKAQPVNGVVVADSGYFKVIKVWGNHYERGYALGYLDGVRIRSIYDGYIKPGFGASMASAKVIIQQGIHVHIDSIFHWEAKGIGAGMAAAGVYVADIDYLDLLVANAFLDLRAFSYFMANSSSVGLGCSSLLDWGSATTGTDLNGHSVISRHLDWTTQAAIVNNQVMVIHFPSEPDEVPWLLIGFSGQISALSGISSNKVAAFQHMMSDVSPTAPYNKAFEPVWFSMRKGLEADDFNSDGLDNTNDIRSALIANTNGYSDGYIVTMLAPSTAGGDSLTGQIAELASAAPLLTFRSCCYNDSLQGENIYAANSAIARNNVHHYCSRYNSVIPEVGLGTGISSSLNWSIMRDFSNAGTGNIQFMQYIPEESILRLAVYHNGIPGYLNDSVQYNTDSLFSLPTVGIHENNATANLNASIYPNPASDRFTLSVSLNKSETVMIQLFDSKGMMLESAVSAKLSAGVHAIEKDISKYSSGIYFCKVITAEGIRMMKLVKK